MKKAFADLFSSKKFIVMMAAILSYIAARVGFDVPPGEAEKILLLVGVWLGSQGVSDGFGKGKVQAEALAKTTAPPL